jgi:hypothetical protein
MTKLVVVPRAAVGFEDRVEARVERAARGADGRVESDGEDASCERLERLPRTAMAEYYAVGRSFLQFGGGELLSR